MLEACMKQHPDRTLIRDRLAQFYCGLANELPSAEGELLLHQVSTLCQPLTRWNRGIVASSLSILAQRHASRNELTIAINLARRGIETHAGAVEEVPTHSAERGRLALGMVACARLLARGGRIEEATSMLRDAARHANRTIQENPGVAHYLEVRSIVQQAIVSLANEHGGPADGAALLALHNERLAADYLARSQEYAGLGNDDLRMADLRTALKLDPNNLAAINEAYAGHLNRGEMEDAKTMALQAVAIPQERVKDWRIRGEQFQLLGEYAKAIQAFDRFADEQAGAWWIVKRRGVANFLDGRYDAALRDMTYALHAKPDEDSTLTWIDPSLLAACPNDDFRNGMLKLADEAVELNHGAPGHLATRGVLLANMKKIAEAQADFDAAIASPRARTFDLYWAAMANLLLDDREAYRDVCETMCERFRENQEPDALHWAAWTCVLVPSAVKNYDAAIVLARRAFAQRPTKQKELLGLGAVLFRASQFEEAKQHLTAAAAAPNLTAACPAFPWYFLAMTHHRLGQHEDAQEWLAQATEFTAKTRTEPQTDRGLWNRRLTLELLDAEAKALLAGD